MFFVSRMEQIRLSKGNAPKHYEKTWKPFLALFDET